MKLDLESIIRIAISLDHAADDLDRWSVDVLAVERGLATAAPADLKERCRRLSLLWGPIDRYMSIGTATNARIAERLCQDGDQEEVRSVLVRQQKQSHDLASSFLRLRRQVRDLEMVVGGAISDYERQGLDTRLLRLVGDERRGMTVVEIHDAVRNDHENVSEAKIAWRRIHSDAPMLAIRESSSRKEVEEALRRLERTGHATRIGSIFGQPRWTVHRTPEEKRLRA